MSTHTSNQQILAPDLSFQLFKIVEDGDFFEPIEKVNSQSGKWMSIEMCSDDEDGTFPTVQKYINLINRMESDGTSAFLDWYCGKKIKSDNGYCVITRKTKYGVDATIEFKSPITIVFGKVGEELVTKQVSKITGEFTHEWFWMKGERRQNRYANGFEIFFDCQTFE